MTFCSLDNTNVYIIIGHSNLTTHIKQDKFFRGQLEIKEDNIIDLPENAKVIYTTPGAAFGAWGESYRPSDEDDNSLLNLSRTEILNAVLTPNLDYNKRIKLKYYTSDGLKILPWKQKKILRDEDIHEPTAGFFWSKVPDKAHIMNGGPLTLGGAGIFKLSDVSNIKRELTALTLPKTHMKLRGKTFYKEMKYDNEDSSTGEAIIFYSGQGNYTENDERLWKKLKFCVEKEEPLYMNDIITSLDIENNTNTNNIFITISCSTPNPIVAMHETRMAWKNREREIEPRFRRQLLKGGPAGTYQKFFIELQRYYQELYDKNGRKWDRKTKAYCTTIDSPKKGKIPEAGYQMYNEDDEFNDGPDNLWRKINNNTNMETRGAKLVAHELVKEYPTFKDLSPEDLKLMYKLSSSEVSKSSRKNSSTRKGKSSRKNSSTRKGKSSRKNSSTRKGKSSRKNSSTRKGKSFRKNSSTRKGKSFRKNTK